MITYVKPQAHHTPATMLGNGDRQILELAGQPSLSFKVRQSQTDFVSKTMVEHDRGRCLTFFDTSGHA